MNQDDWDALPPEAKHDICRRSMEAFDRLPKRLRDYLVAHDLQIDPEGTLGCYQRFGVELTVRNIETLVAEHKKQNPMPALPVSRK